MKNLPKSIANFMDKARLQLKSRPELLKIFLKCFPNTLEMATEFLEDGLTFIITGDIPAMWLRDSAAQVKHYLFLSNKDTKLRKIIEGLIRQQCFYITIDPYANAFNREPNGQSHEDNTGNKNPWVWERKYEMDSLCSPIQLSYLYWKYSNQINHFDDTFRRVCNIIVNQFILEQRHHENSTYFFSRDTHYSQDTLRNHGKGMPVNYTGMTWSGFRPSDDACTFGYLIPANAFATVILQHIQEIAENIYNDEKLRQRAAVLEKEIRYGIMNYGIYLHPKYGPIYAYETDGYGNYNLIDDANIPSLLSLPYLGYCEIDDLIYQNTRAFILSEDNKFFYSGKFAQGIGSSHTPVGNVWHLSLIMQALTSQDLNEIRKIINTLEQTHASTYYMHESFNPDCPDNYTRTWFGWANSLFSELIVKCLLNEMDVF